MSALAKAVLGFRERGVTIHYDGFVQVPESIFEKWVEFARAENTKAQKREAQHDRVVHLFHTEGGSR